MGEKLSFDLQQPSPGLPGIATDAGRRDYTMTRNEKWPGIFPAGTAYGARTGTENFRQPCIGNGVTSRYIDQFRPDTVSKWRTLATQCKAKLHLGILPVLLQLLQYAGKHFRTRAKFTTTAVAAPFAPDQHFTLAVKRKFPRRRIHNSRILDSLTAIAPAQHDRYLYKNNSTKKAARWLPFFDQITEKYRIQIFSLMRAALPVKLRR